MPVTDRHRDEIAAVLTERGLVVKTDVGLSDFRIDLTLASASTPPSRSSPSCSTEKAGVRAERWRIAMAFPSMSSGVDALAGIERVWLPEWLDDPDATADRLVAAVHSAEAGGSSDSAATVESVAPQAEDHDSLRAEEPSELLGGEVLGVQTLV